MNPSTLRNALVVVFAFMVISGIGGVVAGGTSAMAGWWCIVVGGIFELLLLRNARA